MEGYLFLVIYNYYKDIILEGFVEDMILIMNIKMVFYYNIIKVKNMFVNDVLILLFFVEKEGLIDEDCCKIVSVFYNWLLVG